MTYFITSTQLKARFRILLVSSIACFAVCVCCVANAEDPLPSWNDGPPKKVILEFVAAVTDENGKQAGEGRIEKTIPDRYSMDTFDVGMDLNAAVDKDDYKTPFKFTGTIEKVTIELKE